MRSGLLEINRLAAVMTAALLFAITGLSADEDRTVLAIGDSITAGGGSFSCYREFLVPELTKRGFRFIGPVRDATSAHAGYGGKNTAFLRSGIREIYEAHPADIVLIHAGHNNFAKDNPVPRIIADTEAIIGTIREINPKVSIRLAQVIPSGKLPKYSYIPELNKELADLAERLAEAGAEILLVNQAQGFDWRTDTVADMVHPNESGAKKMATKWLETFRAPDVRKGPKPLAEPLEPERIESLIEQLGSSAYPDRQAAKDTLQEELSLHPDVLAPLIRRALESTENPEVRLSLLSLTRQIGRGILVSQYTFDPDSYRKNEWKLLNHIKNDYPVRSPPPEFRDDGSLKVDSSEFIRETVMLERMVDIRNATHRVVFEGKVKVLQDEESDTPELSYCGMFQIMGDDKSEILWIDADGIQTANEKIAKVPIKMKDVWRQIRIEGFRDSFKVYVDDADDPLIDIPWRKGRGKFEPRVRFGDGASRGGGVVLYNDVRVSIYEAE